MGNGVKTWLLKPTEAADQNKGELPGMWMSEREFYEELISYKKYVRQFSAIQLQLINTYTAVLHIDFPNYLEIEILQIQKEAADKILLSFDF